MINQQKKLTQINFKVDKNQNSSKTKKYGHLVHFSYFLKKKNDSINFTKIREICNALNKCVKSMCCATLEKTEEFLMKFVVLLNCVSSCFKIMNDCTGKYVSARCVQRENKPQGKCF